MNSCINCHASTKNQKFCSRKCAVTVNNTNRKHSSLTKEKISKSLAGRVYLNKRIQLLEKTCPICSAVFVSRNKTCSYDCGIRVTNSKRGKKSAQSRVRRSKDEIELYNLVLNLHTDAISNYIIQDGWDADIVIPSLKIAIFWNGPWHYKQLSMKNHSLKQVQNRDNIKKQLFSSLGWKVIMFEDRYYTPCSAFKELVGISGTAPLPSAQ